MHKNLIWQAFLLFVGIATLWYTSIAAYRYYTYSQLKASKNVDQIHWDVHEKKADAYILEAHYGFQVNGENFSGQMLFEDQLYLNRWGAEQAVAELAPQPAKVWYDPTYPARSTLNKSFPLKEIFYSIMLWGLFIYFIWLGVYVKRLQQ